jgi:hypothetical protein
MDELGREYRVVWLVATTTHTTGRHNLPHMQGHGLVEHLSYSLRPKKNDVLGFKICPNRMTFT